MILPVLGMIAVLSKQFPLKFILWVHCRISDFRREVDEKCLLHFYDILLRFVQDGQENIIATQSPPTQNAWIMSLCNQYALMNCNVHSPDFRHFSYFLCKKTKFYTWFSLQGPFFILNKQMVLLSGPHKPLSQYTYTICELCNKTTRILF
jgi:hypothetical protein